MTYLSLTQLAQQRVAQQLQAGQIAIDATVGNGHDTVFLAASVNSQGQIFGFDIQPPALANTHQRLLEAGLDNQVTLLHNGHERMGTDVPASLHGRVNAIMFNLGYLPGSDKNTVTQPETTTLAIQAATELLAPGGIMSILVYRGHTGGLAEADAVALTLDSLSSSNFEVTQHTSPGPWLYLIRKL